MASYTTQQLIVARGCSTAKWYEDMKIVRKKYKFKKTSIGVLWNEPDAKKISEIFGFTLPDKSNGK